MTLEGDSSAAGTGDIPDAAWAVLRDWLDEDPIGKAIIAILGSDPATAAAALHERLRTLQLPPALATYVLGGQIDKLVNIAAIYGSVTIVPHRPERPRPRELPLAIIDFTGRHSELTTLTSSLMRTALEGSTTVSAIHGPAGVGKSALAIHAAYQCADEFADGQVYVDLYGSTPGIPSMEPSGALTRMMRSLGVPKDEIQVEPEAAAAQFRSITAGLRLLIVLDNAVSTAQVTPLLPSGRRCAVLITSRRALTTLRSAASVPLAPFPEDEAVDLLEKIIGAERVSAAPVSAMQIARLCGFLPLALRIAGIRLANAKALSFVTFASRLESAMRLDELEEEDSSIRSSLDISYNEFNSSTDLIDRQAADAFRMFGIIDVGSIRLSTLTRLVAWHEETTRLVANRLVNAQLLLNPREDRYAMHDLVRLYARGQSSRQDTEAERLAGLTRVLEHSIATARQISHILQPSDRRRSGSAADRSDALPLRSKPEALAWIDEEVPSLIELMRQTSDLADTVAARTATLAHALYWAFKIHGHYRDWQTADQLGIASAERVGDSQTKAYLLGDLADVLARLGQVHHAYEQAVAALDIFEKLNDRAGQARTSNLIGNLHTQEGRWDEGSTYYERSTQLYREIGDRHAQALVIGNLGLVAAERGDAELAHSYLLQVLSTVNGLDDPLTESQALTNLAESSLQLNRAQEAIRYSNEAIRIATELQDPSIIGIALNARGEAYRQIGDAQQAFADQRQSLSIAHELGLRYSIAEALMRLGLALRDLGRPGQGKACWRRALAIFDEIQAPESSDVRQLLEGLDP